MLLQKDTLEWRIVNLNLRRFSVGAWNPDKLAGSPPSWMVGLSMTAGWRLAARIGDDLLYCMTSLTRAMIE
jgi:hypothetical protein